MSCSSYHSCQACTDSPFYCHWCGDSLNGQCYSRYNVFECVWSTPCDQLEKCVRKQPEFIATEPRSKYLNKFIIAMAFWSLLFLPFLFRKMLFRRKSRNFMLEELPSTSTSGKPRAKSVSFKLGINKNNANNSDDLTLNQDTENIQPLLENHGDLNADDVVRENSRHRRILTRVGSTLKSCSLLLWTLLRKSSGQIVKFACYFLAFFTLGFLVFLFYISPGAPDFSVCTSELNWESLLNTFTSFGSRIHGDYILQASIYNPNRFDMALKLCKGSFTFENKTIGTFSVDWKHSLIDNSNNGLPNNADEEERVIVVPVGSIFDVLFIASLNIPMPLALDMVSQYRNSGGDLILGVDTEAKVGIRIATGLVYTLDYNLPPTLISLKDLHDDQCKCRLNMTRTRSLPFSTLVKP